MHFTFVIVDSCDSFHNEHCCEKSLDRCDFMHLEFKVEYLRSTFVVTFNVSEGCEVPISLLAATEIWYVVLGARFFIVTL